MIIPLVPGGDELPGGYTLTHDELIDRVIVLGLSKLPETHWKASNAADPPSAPNTPSLSSTVTTTAVSSLLDTALANDFLPRPVLIQTPGASSASGPKRHLETVDESVAYKRSRK